MNIKNIKPYTKESLSGALNAFLDYADLQYDCREALNIALGRICDDEEAFGMLCEQIDVYYADYNIGADTVFGKLAEIGKKVSVHEFTVYSVYLILLCPHLLELYEQKGYPKEVYDSSILDIKWKLIECKKVKGIWGSFVAWWTLDVFTLKIFGMGRLVFNPFELGVNYKDGGLVANKGDLVLETHIPSCGPLSKDEYMKSFERAEKFFTKFFPECVRENYVVFCCISWLITPQNHEILPEKSRVREFADNFRIVEYNEDKNNGDLWRLFNVEKLPPNPENLPDAGSLGRAYINWFKQGKCMGEGYGVMFYKNGKILK